MPMGYAYEGGASPRLRSVCTESWGQNHGPAMAINMTTATISQARPNSGVRVSRRKARVEILSPRSGIIDEHLTYSHKR